MSDLELVTRALLYALAAAAVVGGSIHYGWQLRERLALKLEHFRITNRQWAEYDEQLKSSRGRTRGQLVGLTSDRSSDR